eukprot:2524150-Ditylum_brightwellii.AAC.1
MSSGFPRHNGVDNNASVQTSEAAVMKKMKTFDMANSNETHQNALNGVSNTSKIKDDKEILWRRKLDLAYGSMDKKEKKSDEEESIIEPSYKDELINNPRTSN